MKNYEHICLLFYLASTACRQESDNAIAISSNGPGEVNDPDVDQKIKDRVQKLAEKIDINDNPVILIGKMK